MRTEDESLSLSSSVLKAKLPYWKRSLRRAWLYRNSSRLYYYYSAMRRHHKNTYPEVHSCKRDLPEHSA